MIDDVGHDKRAGKEKSSIFYAKSLEFSTSFWKLLCHKPRKINYLIGISLANLLSTAHFCPAATGGPCRGAHGACRPRSPDSVGRVRRSRTDGPPCGRTCEGTRRNHSTIPLDARATRLSSFSLPEMECRHWMLVGSD